MVEGSEALDRAVSGSVRFLSAGQDEEDKKKMCGRGSNSTWHGRG